MLEYKNIKTFYKMVPYNPNWSEEAFGIKEDTVPWTYGISDLQGEGIFGTFYENKLWKVNQKEFRIEKLIKRKGDKLYVEWKGYDNSFNKSINEKDI